MDLQHVAFVLAVVQEALEVVAAVGTVDHDWEHVDAACHRVIKHVRQLVLRIAPSCPGLAELIDHRR